MTFLSTFSTSVSALDSTSLAFQVIGENIANSRTPGFKAADVRFDEVLVATVETQTESLGGTNAVVQQFIDQQGILESTGNELDVAIIGNGFLVSNTNFDESGEVQLSRNGQLRTTIVQNGGAEQSYLTDLAGNFVLAWPANPDGTFNAATTLGALDPIRVDTESTQFEPQATTEAALNAILPAGAATGTVRTASIPVIDSAGGEQAMVMQFTKNAAANSWNLAISAPNGTVTSGAAATLTFDAAGTLVSPTTQSVGMSFGSGGAATVALDLSAIRAFGSPFNVIGFSQNGIPEGRLQSLSFDEDGVLSGLFSNGQTRPLYKLPLATVANPNQLELRNSTHFALGDKSGDIALFEADLTEIGRFAPASVEQSTTDLATEFNNLILAQQSYSMAVQAYTVTEEMTQTATQLKR